jgi:branched-chain amino acid transport system ATP-binding protein
MMALLEVEHLSAFYGKAQALHDVSFSVEEGGVIALIGANGAGKSTLLDSIIGLTKTTGDIRFDGVSIVGKGSPHIVQQGIGYAPERFNLFPYMSVRDNLLVGAYTARGDIERNLETIHTLFPRLAEREHQETSTQSGGERQMVSLGRALMSSPRLLLVDEPTIGLAPKVCLEIAEVLRRLRGEFGLTVVITEQNANFAMTLAEHVYVLESGHLTTQGSPDELRKDEVLAAAYFGH